MTPAPFWAQRSPRERAVLGWGAAALAALLFVALAWIPLERERARLEHEVPQWRGTVAALQREADEVRRLRSMPRAAASSAPLAALAGGGLAVPPGTRLTLVDERRLKLAGDDVGFTQLLDWLASTQAAQGLRVESAHVEALAASGRVRAEITLARS